MAETKENIVMFPFMGQGHIIPFLALALQLEKTNRYTITFVSTNKNLKKLSSSLPPNSSFNLAELPFDSSYHNLPPDIENTDSIPHVLVYKFVEATLSFKPHFRKLISDLVSEENGQKPLCIVSDMLFGWCEEIAQEFGVFYAMFVAGGGFGFACLYSLWMNPPGHQNTDSDEFIVPDYPQASGILVTEMKDNLEVADESDAGLVLYKKLLSLWKNVNILVNTVEELDKIGLSYFRREIGRQVWPIGPALLPTGSQARAGKENGISPEVCKNWLDTKPCSSVLYVSFGSQSTIAPLQMMELALGLEASGKDFIWVVRPPLGFDINSEFKAEEYLPQGFEERTRNSNKGLVVHKWAPQVDILSHKSISAFLSHCGWNSVLEALSHGVPIISWPMIEEQFYNAKLLEEQIGVCVEVAVGSSCEVRHEEIVAKIELVMNETEKGKEMKKKASEAKEIIENAIKDEENYKGSSTKAIDDFLNAAFTMRERTKE